MARNLIFHCMTGRK